MMKTSRMTICSMKRTFLIKIMYNFWGKTYILRYILMFKYAQYMPIKWFWWKWPISTGGFRHFRVLRVVCARKWSISYGPYDMDMIHMKLNISLNKYGRYIKFNENKDISSFQFPAANPLVKKTYSLSFQASFQRNWSSNNEYILKNGICSHFILLSRCPNDKLCQIRYIFQIKMA